MAERKSTGVLAAVASVAAIGGFAGGRFGGEPLTRPLPAHEYQLSLDTPAGSAAYRVAAGEQWEAIRSPGDPAWCWQLTVASVAVQIPASDPRCGELDEDAAYLEAASGETGARASRMAALRVEHEATGLWGFQLGGLLEAPGTWRPL